MGDVRRTKEEEEREEELVSQILFFRKLARLFPLGLKKKRRHKNLSCSSHVLLSEAHAHK